MAEQVITEVKAILSAQDKNFSSTFSDASRKMSAFEKSATAIGAVVGGAGIALISFGKQAFMQSARVRELDVAMQAIGKSTGIGYQQINEATKAIRKNGIEMAASQQIAIQFAQNQLDIAQASKVARVAQDLAVIGAKDSTETTLLLTQAIITGRTELLKSAGVQKSAGQMYDEFARSAGKSASALTAVEKQTAVLNGVLAEGTKVAGTYEAAMTEPGKVLRSFPRLFNDIQVAMGKGLTDGFGPMIMAAYNMTKAFAGAIGEGGKLQGVVTLISGVAKELAQPLTRLIEQMTGFIKSLSLSKAEAAGMLDKFKPLVSVILAISTALATLGGRGFLGMIPGLSQFAFLLNPIAAGLAVLIATTPMLQYEIKRLFGAFQPLLPILLGVGKAVAEGLTNALKILIPVISSVVTFVSNLLKPLSDMNIKSEDAGRKIKILADFVTGLTVGFLAYKTAVMAVAIAQGVATLATALFTGGLQALKVALISTGIGAIIVLIGTLAAAFYTAWQNSQSFRDKVVGAFNAIGKVVQLVIDSILGQINLFIRAWNALPFTKDIPLLSYTVAEMSRSVIGSIDSANGKVDEYSGNWKSQINKINAESKNSANVIKDATDLQNAALDSAKKKMDEAKQKVEQLTNSMNDANKSFSEFVVQANDTRTSTERVSNLFTELNGKLSNNKLKVEDLVASFQDLSSRIKNEFSEALSNARSQLDEARSKFEAFKDSIKGSITGMINFQKAVETGDFLKGLTDQANNATKFAEKVKQLIGMGLSEEAITKILEAGYDAGTAIADQIIAGGQTIVNQVNA